MLDTPNRRMAAASAIRAILAGTADVAATASAFGLPLDLPREKVVSALLDIASPPAPVIDLNSRRATRGGVKAATGAPEKDMSYSARKARESEIRERNNRSTSTSYRLPTKPKV